MTQTPFLRTETNGVAEMAIHNAVALAHKTQF